MYCPFYLKYNLAVTTDVEGGGGLQELSNIANMF